MIDTILFDLEGVIIDTPPIWDKVATEFLQRRGFTFEKEKLRHLTMGRSLAEGIKIWQEYYGFEGELEQLTEERRQIAYELFQTDIEFIPGFHNFYASIKDKYKTAIATSLERYFFTAIDVKLKLSELFNSHVYSIADIGFISKPNPDIYLYAAQMIGSDPAHCIGIEDAPNGVEAIKRAGMKAIAITTSNTRERLANADIIIDSYTELDVSIL